MRTSHQDDILYADDTINTDLAVLFNQEKLKRNNNNNNNMRGQTREPLSLDNNLFNSDSFRPLTSSSSTSTTSEKNSFNRFFDDAIKAEIVLNGQASIDRRSDAPSPLAPSPPPPPRTSVSPAINPSNGFWNVMQKKIKEKNDLMSENKRIQSYEKELERILAADSLPRIRNVGSTKRPPLPPMMGRKPPAITLKSPSNSKDPVVINNFGSSGK